MCQVYFCILFSAFDAVFNSKKQLLYYINAFSALTQLVGRQEEHLVSKNK